MTAQPTAVAAGPARGKRPAHGEPLLDRAFAVLAAFTDQRGSMNLAELSRHSGLPKSTALRLARKLAELGVLQRAPDGDFMIGLRLWEIASLAGGLQEIRAAAMPFMEGLNQVTNQHVLLAVREGNEALLLERLSARTAGPVLYRVGGRLPLHSTGVGQILLAFSEFSFQQRYVSATWQVEPEGRPVSSTDLRRALAQARRAGHAMVARPELGMVSVAAPIWDGDGTISAALSVVVPPAKADARALVPLVREAAQAISSLLESPRATVDPTDHANQ